MKRSNKTKAVTKGRGFERREFLTRTLVLAGGAAASSALPGLAALPAQAQQIVSTPVTSYNPATDHLDRTKAGPITRPMIVEIANNTYFLNEFGMDSQYVIVGKTRALAIDTGTGFYNYKGTIEKLTKLPYDVAVTHGHPDHAGGIGQFDAVYLHRTDIPMLKNITQEGAKRYGEIMWNMPIGYRDVWGYTPADAKWGNWGHRPEIKPLFDGQVFDLGGRKVTVYHAPGHTLGSCTFVDDQSKIIFSGDAANFNVGAMATSVSTLLRSLLKLRNIRANGEFVEMFWGHVAYAGTIDVYPEAPQVLDDLIEAFRSVLRGNPKTEVVRNHLFPQRTQTVAVYGSARVGFNPKHLWEPGEPHVIP